ncbi:MAG: glycosyltransferase family 39 protein [Calditrichaeota bacterium]|nr:glycosyltransferase family 39 protein [Calditrichota bacterium]MCB9391345.1 glycosyltransferase family 39 protein [Calditrichota bacterium]
MSNTNTTSLSTNEKRALGIVLIGALLLRLYGLASESFWLDEAITWHRVKGGPLSFLFDWDADTQGPVYTLLLWIWSKVFGVGEVAMRVPSVIFGVLGLHAMYLLGRRIFSHRAALWATAFAAVNPFLIYYAQEARPYALWFWTSLMAIWYLLRLIEKESRINTIGTITFTLLSLYTHPYGPFLLALHCAMVLKLAPRPEWKRFVKPALIIAIAYLPELATFAYALLGKIRNKWSVAAWIYRPGLTAPWIYMQSYFAWNKLAAACSLVLLGGVFLYRKRMAPYRTGFITVGAILFGFFALPWLVSQIAPILWMRYTITVVAAVLLLLGWITAETRKPLQYVAVGLFFLASGLPLYHYFTEFDKDPWRQAVAWLAPQVKPEDAFLIHPLHAPMPLEYYLNTLYDHPVVVLRDTSSFEDALPDSGAFWFVAATYSHSAPLRAKFYDFLDRTCDCDSTYHTAELFPRNPFLIFRADIELTRCQTRAPLTSQP